MANDPPFAEQQANLRRYRPFGGDQPVPGGIESLDRFVRASYFLHYLPEPRDAAEAVAGVVSIAGAGALPAWRPLRGLRRVPHLVGVGHRPHPPDLLLLVPDEPGPGLGRASPPGP